MHFKELIGGDAESLEDEALDLRKMRFQLVMEWQTPGQQLHHN